MWCTEEEAELAAQGSAREDSALDMYLAAAALEGKRESVVTDYMLRILGMDVRPLLLLACRGFPGKPRLWHPSPTPDDACQCDHLCSTD